ncbi:MAG: hypothetical protein ACOX81_08495 [Candidatus Heteroscillospira sp.]
MAEKFQKNPQNPGENQKNNQNPQNPGQNQKNNQKKPGQSK